MRQGCLSEAALAHLLGLARLTELDLRNSRHRSGTESGPKYLGSAAAGRALRRPELCCCTALKDAALASLGMLSQLRELSFHGRGGFGVHAPVTSAPRLA